MTDETESAANQLQAELKALGEYQENPITVDILRQLESDREVTIAAILDFPIKDQAQLFIREQLVGELRGLRRFKIEIEDRIDNIKTKLNEYGNRNDSDRGPVDDID